MKCMPSIKKKKKKRKGKKRKRTGAIPCHHCQIQNEENVLRNCLSTKAVHHAKRLPQNCRISSYDAWI